MPLVPLSWRALSAHPPNEGVGLGGCTQRERKNGRGRRRKWGITGGRTSEVEERGERSGDEGQSTMWSDWCEAG